jgi:hypothetical protein
MTHVTIFHRGSTEIENSNLVTCTSPVCPSGSWASPPSRAAQCVKRIATFGQTSISKFQNSIVLDCSSHFLIVPVLTIA